MLYIYCRYHLLKYPTLDKSEPNLQLQFIISNIIIIYD